MNLEAVLIFFRAYLRGAFEDDFSVERTTIAGYRSERYEKSDPKAPKGSQNRKKTLGKKPKQLLRIKRCFLFLPSN